MLPTLIPNYLIEAYEGYYEEKATGPEWIIDKINSDDPNERLRIYCVWNGILGYDNILFDIATKDGPYDSK